MGELLAKPDADTPSPFKIGDRVFHQKFGNGNVAAIEANKLTSDLNMTGEKKESSRRASVQLDAKPICLNID